MSDLSPIGVFDSGMGGLTVLAALRTRLPKERFIYLGDTARLPYGTKSPDTVRRYAIQAARKLTEHGVKLVVIACNTASVALAAVADDVAPVPVLGVIEPGAEAALAIAPEGPIAIIATEGTVRGGAYVRAIHARTNVPVVQQACPLFVPISEEGIIEGPIATAVAHRYLDPLLSTMPAPKCLLLACTHYPVLKRVIVQVAGIEVPLVDSALSTAEAVARLLEDRRLANVQANASESHFLVTDSPDRFARVGETFLGQPIDPGRVELIDLN